MTKADRHRTLIGAIGLLITCALTAYAFRDIVNQGFLHWDDIPYVRDNHHLHDLSPANLLWMLFGVHMSNWHPVTWFTLGADFSLWGDNPVAFKIVNVVIHLLCSFMLCALTMELMRAARQGTPAAPAGPDHAPLFAGLSAAVLFAVHPQHVESVVWISQRKDVLCGLFYVAAAYCYLRYMRNPKGWRWYNLSLAAAALAMASKPMAVTLPLALMVLDVWPLRRLDSARGVWALTKALFGNKIGVLGLSACVTVITLISQSGEIQGLAVLGPGERLVSSSIAVLHYLGAFTWPAGLTAFYPFHPWVTEPSLYSPVPVIIVLLICAGSVWAWHRGYRSLPAAWWFFLLALLPVIGFVKIGHVPFADRYAYIPTMGFYILAGIAASQLLLGTRPVRRGSGAIFLTVVLGLLIHVTGKQSRNWRHDIALWESVIDRHPYRVAAAYSNLASMYFNNGEHERSFNLLMQVLALKPGDMGALRNLALIMDRKGDRAGAERYYDRMIRDNPEDPAAYEHLGKYHYKHEEFGAARSYFRQALLLDPASPHALVNLAVVEFSMGHLPAARSKLGLALSLEPDHRTGLQLLAKVQYAERDPGAAIDTAHELLRHYPGDKFARDLLEDLAPDRESGAH